MKWALCIFMSACSFVIDDEQGALPLVGATQPVIPLGPPMTSTDDSDPFDSIVPAFSHSADGTPWMYVMGVLRELAPPFRAWFGDLAVTDQAVFALRGAPCGDSSDDLCQALVVGAPDAVAIGSPSLLTIDVPTNLHDLSASDDGNWFAISYWNARRGNVLYIALVDGSVGHFFSAPTPHVDSAFVPDALVLANDGPPGFYGVAGATIFPTSGKPSVNVNPRIPGFIALAPDETALISCSEFGLFRHSITTNQRRLLDSDGCSPPTRGADYFSLKRLRAKWIEGNRAYYFSRAQFDFRSVALDGSEPPSVLRSQIKPDFVLKWHGDRVVYTTTPVDQFYFDATDGWIDDWRFMERGRDVQFSRDGARVRWLEHSANDGDYGNLMSAPIGGAATLLAYNVEQFDELPDGRVLAASNQAVLGPESRLIAIDETSGVAQRVADAAHRYWLVPKSDVILFEQLTDQGSRLAVTNLPAKP